LLDTGEVTRSNGGDQANRSGALHGSKNAISLESTGLGDSGSFSRYFCFDSWCREKLPKTYPFLPVPKPPPSTKVGREAHLTEKPVQIFAYLVTLASRPGDLIGDFYAGSGSSLLAAAGMNRDFIGCDKVAEHVKMAEQRLSVLLVNREKKEITS
ncbi:MAG TPA: DNA methyltransferase, partial [Dehalococcoidia bacterium]|nr:DNA methyltransferase [Dehalococcoidia bacterium]